MGMEFVHYTGGDGVLRSIRRGWTSVAREDPFVRGSSGRSAFRVSDLLALSSLLAGLDGDGRTGREPDGGAGTVKKIVPSLSECFCPTMSDWSIPVCHNNTRGLRNESFDFMCGAPAMVLE